MVATENPFSAHRIRPGAIPYLFSHEDNSTDITRLDHLIDCWKSSGYVGQIVGPHGCGKTTLAYSIAKRAKEHHQQSFDNAWSITIRKKSFAPSSNRTSKVDWLTLNGFDVKTSLVAGERSSRLVETGSKLSTANILMIDGIERLSILQRTLMLRSLASRQIPTLLTVHRVFRETPFVALKWPVLFRVGSDVKVFTKVVNSLTGPPFSIPASKVESTFKAANGNFRDSLMSLYDLCTVGQSS